MPMRHVHVGDGKFVVGHGSFDSRNALFFAPANPEILVVEPRVVKLEDVRAVISFENIEAVDEALKQLNLIKEEMIRCSSKSS